MWANRWDSYIMNDIFEFMNSINEAFRYRNEYPEIPGVNPEDIQLELHDNTFIISVEKKQDLNENYTIIRNEREFGKFTRSFQLPYKINESQIQAEYKYGVLKVLLPKAEEEKPKKIAIKTE